jgi:Uma2 family endonuclease
MAGQTIAQLLTLAEFEKMPEFYERWELIDGKLVEQAVPNWKHNTLADRIRIFYYLFDPEEKVGSMRPEVRFRVRNDYAPIVDLGFWVATRVPHMDIPTASRPI